MGPFYTDIKELEAATEGGVYLVLADNIRGVFSLGTKIRTRGSYGHMMWKIPGGFASQSWTFSKVDMSHYAGCIMKFIYNPDWTVSQKVTLLSKIQEDLDKPWWKNIYDFRAIVGQLLGWDWLQSSERMICSERIAYLRYIDPEVDEWLKVEHTPTPTDVNKYCKMHQHKYAVFARYSPD